MRYRFLLAIVLIAGRQDVKQPEGVDFYVKLKDGTLFSSRFEIKELQIKGEYGLLKIPLSDIRSIKASKTGFTIVTTKQKVEGKINEKITFKTKHGILNVKMEDVAEMAPATKSILLDDNVTGFWDFDSEEGFKFHGGTCADVDGKSVAKLNLAAGNHIEIPHRDEHNGKDQLTVEVKFKYSEDGIVANWINLIRKGQTHYQANFELWLNPSAKQFQNGCWNKSGNFTYGNFPAGKLEPNKWHYFVYVVDCKQKKMMTWLDGEEISSGGYTPVENELKASDAPIYICKETFGNSNTVWIDFVRVSNKARTKDEIKELADAGSIGGAVKPSVDKEFKAVIATKAGEKFTCKLEKESIELESSLGDVKVDSNRIGRINFFEYRKDQIKKLHKKAKELIVKLGEEDPEVREKAQDELTKLGWVIIPVLEENKEHKDEEVKTRVKRILQNYEGRKYEIKKDIVEGMRCQ